MGGDDRVLNRELKPERAGGNRAVPARRGVRQGYDTQPLLATWLRMRSHICPNQSTLAQRLRSQNLIIRFSRRRDNLRLQCKGQISLNLHSMSSVSTGHSVRDTQVLENQPTKLEGWRADKFHQSTSYPFGRSNRVAR